MQKHGNLVDLVKSFPTNIFLQKLASIQKSTSPIKFAHLAEKSKNSSVSNLSTKQRTARRAPAPAAPATHAAPRERCRCHIVNHPMLASSAKKMYLCPIAEVVFLKKR